MKCDLVLLLSKHLEGEISPDVCAEMERHVASCPGCKGACDSLRQTLTMCKRLPAPAVPEKAKAEVRAAISRFLDARR